MKQRFSQWTIASGLPRRWRVVRYQVDEYGNHLAGSMEEHNQPNGRRWCCYSSAAAQKKADQLNAQP